MRDSSVLESGFKSIGYIERVKVKCGKKNCKCFTDPDRLHGPYHYYRYWKLIRNKYRQVRLYISYKQAEKIQSSIDTYREMCEGVGGKYGNFINERKSIRQMVSVNAPLDREEIKRTIAVLVKHMQ